MNQNDLRKLHTIIVHLLGENSVFILQQCIKCYKCKVEDTENEKN